MKQTTEDYYEGKGCKCYAWSQGECACNVDWTPKEVYRLRDEIEAKDKRIAELESAEEIIKLRGQLEQAQAELVTAKVDGIREAVRHVSNSGSEYEKKWVFADITYRMSEYALKLDKDTKDKGES